MARKQENKIVNDMAVVIWKQIGETPLQALERFRAEEIADGKIHYTDVPMTYAGRLDPMAEGELLILIGEECKKKDEYLGLDKEYEVEVLFGIETDTYDTLGLVVQGRKNTGPLHGVDEEVAKKVGTFEQAYPPYSSMTVNGKQLHELARADSLPAEMPTKEVTIYSIEILETGEISAEDVFNRVLKNVAQVTGDFRQVAIQESWGKRLDTQSESFTVVRLKVHCSSGTYMRSLAHDLGKALGIGAIALSITRCNIFLNRPSI